MRADVQFVESDLFVLVVGVGAGAVQAEGAVGVGSEEGVVVDGFEMELGGGWCTMLVVCLERRVRGLVGFMWLADL